MSQYSLENDINSLLRMDAPLAKLPLARYQRKALESSSASVSITSANTSLNQSNASMQMVKTPKQRSAGSSDSSLCGTSKTPNKKTPSKKTPLKSNGKTPRFGSAAPSQPKTPNGGDRFIPNRSTTQFDVGHFKVTQDVVDQTSGDDKGTAHQPLDRQKILSNALLGQDIDAVKVISYATKAPAAPEGFQNGLQVIYCNGKTPTSSHKTRYIPQAPDKILDAPDIMDDYYLNLLDWSRTNMLAVALQHFVYLWNATTGGVQLLLELESMRTYVSSVSWIEDGSILAVGNSNGQVELYDVQTKRRLRVMHGHTTRVGALSWNEHILTSGSREGNITHHDVRQADHNVSTLAAHTMEVCGLRWSPDGRYLATGGNDNVLNVYSVAMNQRHSEPNPVYVFTEHCAAVKALAWCPWHQSILASGGGTADRCIRLWNVNTGANLNTTNTNSQVVSILWSDVYRELISGHGFANNQLTLWKYPTMTKVTELKGHKARVLHMALSPDGTTVVSAAADETLRIWKCFAVDPKSAAVAGKRGALGKKDDNQDIIMRQRIR